MDDGYFNNLFFYRCGLWLLYGLTKQDNKIILVNAIGIFLMISYIVVFYLYTFKKSSVLKQFLLSLAIYIFTIGYMSVEVDNEILLSRLGVYFLFCINELQVYLLLICTSYYKKYFVSGFSACSLTLLTIAAPMSKLFYVIKTKSTDCLPFPMIFMSLIVSSLWFLYGLMEEDVYLSVSMVLIMVTVIYKKISFNFL